MSVTSSQQLFICKILCTLVIFFLSLADLTWCHFVSISVYRIDTYKISSDVIYRAAALGLFKHKFSGIHAASISDFPSWDDLETLLSKNYCLGLDVLHYNVSVSSWMHNSKLQVLFERHGCSSQFVLWLSWLKSSLYAVVLPCPSNIHVVSNDTHLEAKINAGSCRQ